MNKPTTPSPRKKKASKRLSRRARGGKKSWATRNLLSALRAMDPQEEEPQ